jgi:hypothetical protein
MVGSIHHRWDRPDLKEIDFEELGEGFTRQGSQTRKSDKEVKAIRRWNKS